jgi:hypothetical protein
MKVGDLVIMPKAKWAPAKSAVGTVVRAPVNKGKNPQDARVGIHWSGTAWLYVEPVHWLEVISESR